MIRLGMTDKYGNIVKSTPQLKRRAIGIISANMEIEVPKAIMCVLSWLSDNGCSKISQMLKI